MQLIFGNNSKINLQVRKILLYVIEQIGTYINGNGNKWKVYYIYICIYFI